jgi:hypothetical protein
MTKKAMPLRMKLSDGKELVAAELTLLRDLGVDRRQLSWLALRKAQPVREHAACSGTQSLRYSYAQAHGS